MMMILGVMAIIILEVVWYCCENLTISSKAADLQFIRAEGFVFGHVADEGWVEACAGPLLRLGDIVRPNFSCSLWKEM